MTSRCVPGAAAYDFEVLHASGASDADGAVGVNPVVTQSALIG